jgi:dihydroorotate dehydrogenase
MYEFIRRTFLSGDPEEMHHMAIVRLQNMQSSSLGRSLLRIACGKPSSTPIETMGLRFEHPLGIAAGFDKDASAMIGIQEMGFSHVEVGTVTPQPQPGNPKPRIWRFADEKSLVNALGFPGEGMEVVRERLNKARASGKLRIPVGINIGKNMSTPVESAAKDYVAVLKCLYETGDYFAANVSSPNTPGLRDLQAVDSLKRLVFDLMETAAKLGSKPLLVKIAPDLADEDVKQIAQFARESELAGIIAGNTTIQRDRIAAAASLDRGGLSGPPLYRRTVEMLKILRSELRSGQTIISVGGIDNAAKVKECLELGANLVQVYTSLIFLGPRCAKRLAG